MEKVTAHYAERIQQNDDQVLREKEALRNWQMAKQHENQRISEVIELCSKQPAPPAASVPAAPVASTPPASAAKAAAGR
jgi:ribosomal protein L12E/L44/L45/RPP1/RPP2